jgi:hypothetical protein
MGEPYGYRPPRTFFPEMQLKLDPKIEQMLLEMQARQIVQQWLQPNFLQLEPMWNKFLLDYRTWQQQMQASPTPPGLFTKPPPPAPSLWNFKPGAGPATPRPGEMSDVFKAVYKLPVVQKLVEQAHDEGMRQLRVLRNEWNNAGTGDRIIMVTVPGIVVGSMVTMIVANQPTRKLAFDLLKDKDIPIPGVDGLSFVLKDRGVGATVPLGVQGLSATGHFAAPSDKPLDYGVTINFDLMEHLRKKK